MEALEGPLGSRDPTSCEEGPKVDRVHNHFLDHHHFHPSHGHHRPEGPEGLLEGSVCDLACCQSACYSPWQLTCVRHAPGCALHGNAAMVAGGGVSASDCVNRPTMDLVPVLATGHLADLDVAASAAQVETLASQEWATWE